MIALRLFDIWAYYYTFGCLVVLIIVLWPYDDCVAVDFGKGRGCLDLEHHHYHNSDRLLR